MPIERLKRRSDFVAAARAGRKWATPGLVVQARRRDALSGDGLRLGFTASKKVGGAVERNRAKRRLRALAEEVFAGRGDGLDVVLIARPQTVSRPFPLLRRDLYQALEKLGVREASP